jgi:hypothetical protein
VSWARVALLVIAIPIPHELLVQIELGLVVTIKAGP